MLGKENNAGKALTCPHALASDCAICVWAPLLGVSVACGRRHGYVRAGLSRNLMLDYVLQQ